MTQPVTAEPIWINEHFKVEASRSCFVPGYVIVSPTLPVSSLSAMRVDALASLGPTLAMVTKAITAVVHAERVYCSLFCEQLRQVHFHVFPRTTQLLSEYRRTHPTETEVSGPLILDWACRTFDHPIPGIDQDEIYQRIRDYLLLA